MTGITLPGGIQDDMTTEGGPGPRRSTRSRKEAAHFVPIESARKVQGGKIDDEEDDSDNYNDSDDDQTEQDGFDNDDGSDIEEETKQAPKKKRTPKKAVRPRQTRKKATKEDEGSDDEDNEEDTLFAIIRRGRVAFRTWIEDWVTAYSEDSETATREILTSIVHACGCEGAVTEDMLDTGSDQDELVASINALKETMRNEYYPISKGTSAKKVRENLTSFWTKLITAVKDDILYDGVFFETVSRWLTTLSTSPVRAFRHTCTFIALKVNTALLNVHSSLVVDLDKTERQMNSQKEASSKLKQRKENIKRRVKEVKQLALSNFNGIFAHRYKDSFSAIRVDCITELGVWITAKRSFYVDDFDRNIKYIGWMLNDRFVDVRKASLLSLASIYAKEELHGNLEFFTQRFKGRLIEMTDDIDLSVATEALRLMTPLIDFEDTLTEGDQARIFRHLTSADADMRRAAGTYVQQQVWELEIKPGVVESQQEMSERGDGAFDEKRCLMVGLIDFCLEVMSPEEEDTYHFVDALWDWNTLVRDWKCMTDLLKESAASSQLEEPAGSACPPQLTDKQEVVLASLMSSAVQRASEEGSGDKSHRHGPGPESSSTRRNALSNEVTLHFGCELGHLLRQFGSNDLVVPHLVLIAGEFDLTLIAKEKMGEMLDELLVYLTNLMFKHTSEALFDSIAHVMQRMLSVHGSVASKVRLAWKRMGATLGENLRLGLETGPTVATTDSTDNQLSDAHVQPNVSLHINLQRLSILSYVLDTTSLLSDNMCTMLGQLLDDAAQGLVPPSILEVLIRSVYHVLSWKCQRILVPFHERATGSGQEAVGGGEDDDDDDDDDDNDDDDDSAAGANDGSGSGGDDDDDDDDDGGESNAGKKKKSARGRKGVLPTRGTVKDLAAHLHQAIRALGRVFVTSEHARVRKLAMDALGDLCIMASPFSAQIHKRLAPMTYTVEEELTVSITAYVETCLNAPAVVEGGKDEDQPQDADAVTMSLHDKEDVLRTFANLVGHNIVDLKHIVRIVPFCIRQPDLAPTIRAVLSKLRKMDFEGTVGVILHALIDMYERAITSDDAPSNLYDGPIQLAKKMASIFGIDTANTLVRKAILTIHVSGIKYALKVDDAEGEDAVNRITFLEVLRELSVKLHRIDAGQVYELFEEERNNIEFDDDVDPVLLESIDTFAQNLERIRDGVKAVAKPRPATGPKSKKKAQKRKRTQASRKQAHRTPNKRQKLGGGRSFAWGDTSFLDEAGARANVDDDDGEGDDDDDDGGVSSEDDCTQETQEDEDVPPPIPPSKRRKL